MVFYVHTMRSEIEKIRHMSLRLEKQLLRRPIRILFSSNWFSVVAVVHIEWRHAKGDGGEAPRVEIWKTYRVPAPLMDITVRILISGFLHSSRGEFLVTPVRDLRPWHIYLKRESGHIPSTRARERYRYHWKKKRKKKSKVFETSYRIEFSVLPNTNAKV